ncbi:MAG: UDP-N-acetylglucosamine 2-epimerase (non-hydrolyzing) [Krumholzibacteria bacterium]|nr:UDP-N-acetylglucosamine 2-epimerase (non-hydrolyzing) [Candidatus Krumholzibacteria bacterium]
MPRIVYLIAAARPNFMKVAPLWRALAARPGLQPVLIHTGQHYDRNMSDVFFEDLGLPQPDVHLGVGGGSHAQQTAGVMVKFEELCLKRRPDLVVVVGDVNATMATTVVAAKLHIPVAHVEAGLRSRDMSMPEEINRLMTDVVADLLFTPSADADGNLRREGVAEARIHRVGNIMIDTLVDKVEKARGNGAVQRHGLKPQGYGVVTLHRPSNVDDPQTLAAILAVLVAVDLPLIFPAHPRTRKVMLYNGLYDMTGLASSHLRIVDPLGYDEFMNLVIHSKLVLTDSGGLQEETTWLRIPCLTLRPNTERPITVEIGTNELATVASLPGQIARILAGGWKHGRVPELWDGATAPRIVGVIEGFLAGR